MDRKPCVGDRFGWCLEPPYPSTEWEIINIVDENYISMLCVAGPKHYIDQVIKYAIHGLVGGEYLGNFSKSNNFTNLFEILNEETIN